MWSTGGVLIKLVVQVRAFTANFISMIEPLMNPVWVLLFVGEVPSLPAIFGDILILGCITIRAVIQNKKVGLNQIDLFIQV